ncbi:MAG: 30S ribosomal protein S6 [Candidatus Omnitrophica bacterium]|nr:30S ribosomal protein S6 [Candidatus Omnitrophota bacterium]
MRWYDGAFVFHSEPSQDAKTQQLKTLEELIKKLGGQVREKMDLGRRPLGYGIKKQREGTLATVEFELDPAQMQELRKALQLFEGLLTFMITVKSVKREKKPKTKPAPAAVKAPPSQHRSAGAGTHPHPPVTTH